MVDDATGKIMECRFVEEECLEGYLQGLKKYIGRYGLPLAIYTDRHTIFKSPKSEEKPSLTQFGRAMKEPWYRIDLCEYTASKRSSGEVSWNITRSSD